MNDTTETTTNDIAIKEEQDTIENNNSSDKHDTSKQYSKNNNNLLLDSIIASFTKEPTNNTNQMKILLEILGPAYAAPKCPMALFYVETIGIIILSAIIALLSLAYKNLIMLVADRWMTNDINNLSVFFGGEPYYIAIGVGTGIVVGVLKAYVFRFDGYTGFIEIIKELDADFKEAVSIIIVGYVSLVGGACIGPESGLAGIGAALGKLAISLINNVCIRLGKVKTTQESDEEESADDDEALHRRRKLIMLSSLVAAFGTMLPTPATSIMFCVELMGAALFVSHGFVAYTGMIVQLGLAGSTANLVFTSVAEYTLIHDDGIFPGYLLETQVWKNNAVALLFGICTPVCLVIPYFIFAGITKLSVKKLKFYIESKLGKELRMVIMTTIGGAIYGLIGWILPLTVGDGGYQMQQVIKNGNKIPVSVLVLSSYAKMLCYWVSNDTGFVGGIFHPLLMISLLFGQMIIQVTNVSEILGVAVSFILLAAAFTPLPFSMFLLDIALFNLKAYDQVAIFLAIIIAHLFTTGLGIPQAFFGLMTRGNSSEKNDNVSSIKDDCKENRVSEEEEEEDWKEEDVP